MSRTKTTELPRPPAEAFVIPDRETFLRALDLEQPALAEVKEALDRGEVEEAGHAFEV